MRRFAKEISIGSRFVRRLSQKSSCLQMRASRSLRARARSSLSRSKEFSFVEAVRVPEVACFEGRAEQSGEAAEHHVVRTGAHRDPVGADRRDGARWAERPGDKDLDAPDDEGYATQPDLGRGQRIEVGTEVQRSDQSGDVGRDNAVCAYEIILSCANALYRCRSVSRQRGQSGLSGA